tara:strand:- start:710 stop:2050 length:1341 start_codon:yes stop_codon:yes gene_type:complete
MKKIILIFLILITNLNASDLTNSYLTGLDRVNKELSNSPESLDLEVFREVNFEKATKYKSWNIPFKANPNLETLQYYFYRDLFASIPTQYNRYFVEPSQNTYEFKFETIENKFVKKQLKTKGILSYLYFEDGKIIIDEVSPKERLGKLFNDETKFRSNSMGKSLPSYILGHAICEGYIDSVDSTISDWGLVKNTLYENQKLIDILNMTTGDQKYVYDSHMLINGRVNRAGYTNVDNPNIESIMKFSFQDTQPDKKKIYNYNVVNTSLIFNYILFKTGDANFQKLLNKVFQEKVKIKNLVSFYKNDGPSSSGNAHNMFYATRFDYLRIAKAIMDDYQNNTCVGKYLKEIYDRRIPKGVDMSGDGKRGEPQFNRTYSYGGQFHLDYPGIRDKIVFGLGGYGGKAILIDVEDSRIVVVNTIHFNHDRYKYNVKKLLINPIKHGKKSFEK